MAAIDHSSYSVSAVSTSKRDHFVPQFYIRQFTNERGTVFCYDKRKQCIADRSVGNRPKDILHERRFYTDRFGNLDDDLYKPIEVAFAPHFVRLVRDPENAWRHPGFGKALYDWIASQCSRTCLLPDLIDHILKKEGRAVLPDGLPTLYNAFRMEMFDWILRIITGSKWQWKFWRSDERRFVLADHPIYHTSNEMAMGYMLFVPLSPTQMLIGGSERGHQLIRDRDILRGINGLAATWAGRYIYSDCLAELDAVAEMMREKGDPEHDEWIKYAKLPFDGQALRVSEEQPRHDFDPENIVKRFQ